MSAEPVMNDEGRPERVERLLRHAWDGDVSAARRILRRDPDVARDSIFTAAACGDLPEVERRLASNPEDADRRGGPLDWTPLAYVTYSRLDAANATAMARRLLEAGADPNFGFDDGWGSPFKVLTGAIRLGEGARPSHPQALELVDLLVAAGADPYDRQALYNISIVGEDIYWYEVLWRHCEAKSVTGKWRDPDAAWPDGKVKVAMLDYLLGNAVGQNHLVRAEWLLARGADPDAPHFYSVQPVHALAQLSGFLDMTALLERHGATPVPLAGVRAFQAACLRLDEAAARALLADDPQLSNDPAPLLAAAEFGNAPAVALLLALGVSARAVDGEGISPLHRAVQSGSLKAVEVLDAAGADVDLRERRWNGTPLSWAVVLGRPDIAEWLAPRSRDVRALANLGRPERIEAVLRAEPELADFVLSDGEAPTPLFCLPDHGEAAASVARVLLSHGADPARRNGKGLTAIDVARDRDLHEAARRMAAGI